MASKDLKTRWIEALRSGEYKQGMHYLRKRNDEYCCLGVLCDLFDNTKWDTYFNDSSSYEGVHYDTMFASSPPKHIMCEVGLTPVEINLLTDMNDEKGWSFEEIADLIESLPLDKNKKEYDYSGSHEMEPLYDD